MDTIATKTSLELTLVQIAWVVKDIEAAKRFFSQTMGTNNFSEADIIRLKEFQGRHYGQPSDAESLVSIAYIGSTFYELIQPVSGRSIFQDFLDKNPAGGLHHLAYSLPIDKLDNFISEMAKKGYPVVTAVKHPVANIVFFDTTKDIGVFTEIMGITKDGESAVQKMKGGNNLK